MNQGRDSEKAENTSMYLMYVEQFTNMHSRDHFLPPMPKKHSVSMSETSKFRCIWSPFMHCNVVPCEWRQKFQISYLTNNKNVVEVTFISVQLFFKQRKWNPEILRVLVSVIQHAHTRRLESQIAVQWSIRPCCHTDLQRSSKRFQERCFFSQDVWNLKN